MANGPQYSPAGGYGTQDNGWTFNRRGWEQGPQYSPVGGSGTQDSGFTYDGNLWNPSPAPSGGGGGDVNTGDVNTGDVNTGPSAEEQLKAGLDEIYSPVFESLKGQEGQVASQLETSQQDIQGQFDVSGQSLETEKGIGLRGLESEEKGAGKRKEDALTSATRLYDELTRGGQQRFGGATSAGEAFKALTAVEQQRRQGAIFDAYEGAQQKITQFRADLEDKFATANASLLEQKDSALREAQQWFGDAMQQLRTNKALAESDKARASLEMLQELRNKVYTVNMQNYQFAQQLALNKDKSLSFVDKYQQKITESIQGAGNVVQMNFGNLDTRSTAYGGGSSQGPTSATTPYVGQITKRDDEELYA